jgi:nucleoside-diphosphate-sugar epimerase
MVLDALDARAVREAVAAVRADAIVYQATALSDLSDFKHFDRSFAQTNRLRTEGTDIILAAARKAGVRRLVFQSYANHRYARVGGPVKTEDDPLDPAPAAAMRQTVAAMNHLDRAVTEAGGIALRYGNFYGDPDDGLIAAVRARKFPIVGTARVSGRTSTSKTPPPPPSSHSSTTARPSTASSTTSPPPPACGCRSSRGSSAPGHPSASRA